MSTRVSPHDCQRCGHTRDAHGGGDKDCMCGKCMWFVATIRRVARPRGELSPTRLKRIAAAAAKRDDAEANYRDEVLAAMTYDGASFSEVSKATGLSTNTLQRWKREYGLGVVRD